MIIPQYLQEKHACSQVQPIAQSVVASIERTATNVHMSGWWRGGRDLVQMPANPALMGSRHGARPQPTHRIGSDLCGRRSLRRASNHQARGIRMTCSPARSQDVPLTGGVRSVVIVEAAIEIQPPLNLDDRHDSDLAELDRAHVRQNVAAERVDADTERCRRLIDAEGSRLTWQMTAWQASIPSVGGR
ncbi:MAG: hypothetical protein ACR2H2_01190 [Solirubrobacteraceae bacterium]